MIVLRRVIHKFAVPLSGPGSFTLQLPVGATALCVQLQHGEPQMWVWLDHSMPQQEQRTFHVLATEQPVDLRRPLRYIGTWQDGPFVWHLFEEHP